MSRMLSIRLWMRFQNDEQKLTSNEQLSRAMTLLRVARLRIRQKAPSWHTSGDMLFFVVMAMLIIYFNVFWDPDATIHQAEPSSSPILGNENDGLVTEL